MSVEFGEEKMEMEELEEKIEETQLLKVCKMAENNHVHHFHDLLDPMKHYNPVKGCNIEELFFDLVFVGAGGNITHGLRHGHLDWESYFLYMGSVLIFWKNFSLNRSVFDTSDLLDKFAAGAYGAGVIGLAIFATGGLDGDTTGYFGDCCVYLSILQLAMDFRGLHGMFIAIQHDKRADHRESKSYNYMVYVMVVDFIMLFFWLVYQGLFGLIDDDAESRRPLLWICALFPMIVDAISSLVFPLDAQIFSPTSHMNERFEAIVLIMLGETILGITPALTNENTNSVVIGAIMCSYFVMFLYKTFHFDVEEYDTEIHALSLGGFRRVVWMYFTIVECVGVILLGSGCGELVDAVLKSQGHGHGHGHAAHGHAAHGHAAHGHAAHGHAGHSAERRFLNGHGGHHEEHWEDMVEKAILMVCVGTALSLASNMLCRFAHGIKIETFYGATALWYVQQIYHFITIFLIIPLPFMFKSEMLPTTNPYLCSLIIVIILFTLDMLFFMDEIIENIHLKSVRANMIADQKSEDSGSEAMI